MPVAALPLDGRLDMVGAVEHEIERHLEHLRHFGRAGNQDQVGGTMPITGVTSDPVTVR